MTTKIQTFDEWFEEYYENDDPYLKNQYRAAWNAGVCNSVLMAEKRFAPNVIWTALTTKEEE